MMMAAGGNVHYRNQCPDCDRTFARAEHLTRHRRTHTQEKPFACHLCPSTFPRADVRARHLRNHHGVDIVSSRPHKVACETCRRRKVRCDCEKGLADFSTSYGDSTQVDEIASSQDRFNPSIDDDAAPQIFTGENIDTSCGTHGLDSALDFFNTALPDDPNFGIFDSTQDLFLTPPFYLDFPWDEEYDPWSLDFYYSSDMAASPLPPNVENARRLIEEYQERRSGRSSPERQSHPQRWGSAAPTPHIYDHAVVSIFVGLAKIHLSSTFRLIADFYPSKLISDESYLALAAVGGLYCTVDGSYKIARAMFNDSRRMALTSRFQAIKDVGYAMKLSKTFLLLEIYGLCSGDKRSFEFVEAFHVNTIQAVECCIKLAEPVDQSYACILECLLVLESYRVVLLHRPPTLPPRLASMLFSLSIDYSPENPTGFSTLEHLFHPGAKASKAAGGGMRMDTLAYISLFVFPISPRCTDQSGSCSFWRPEFVELALDGWARAQDSLSGPLKILYHTIHIRLHANISQLQHLAMAKPHSVTDSDATTGASEDLRAWIASSGYTVSKWHAESTLAESKKLASRVSDPALTERAGRSGSLDSPSIEPPHLAYCVYYATLVLWAGSTYAPDSSSMPEVHLHAGATILAGMRVRVSGLLAKALREIIS